MKKSSDKSVIVFRTGSVPKKNLISFAGSICILLK